MLSKNDRLAFSASIIETAQEIAGLASASAQIQQIANKAQALDTANKHLFDPANLLVNQYQAEFNLIDGNLRTAILENDINDSASKKLGNFFYPNNVLLTIPSLSAKNNVWVQIKPFSLAYGVGKNYDQSYTIGSSEQALIADAQALISSALAYTNIQNTTGQQCENTGTCSFPLYTTETDCIAHGGVWTPTGESIVAYPAVQTLKTNLTNKITTIINQTIAEYAALNANSDTNSGNVAQIQAAKNDINNNITPALNAWLGYSDFNTAHGQTTCAGFNGYDSNLLAPTKLHSAQLAALITALTARSTFLTTRVSQLNSTLGTITQNIDTGDYTGTGFYKKRFDYLNLRINVMSGSLSDLVNSQQSIIAQGQISSSLASNKDIYMSILPTTKLSASANGTAVISLTDASLYSVGNTVYITSDTQDEIVRAIKSINGSSVVLDSAVPTKYTALDNTRLYKDNS
jgi:hypothetical protein